MPVFFQRIAGTTRFDADRPYYAMCTSALNGANDALAELACGRDGILSA